MRTSQGLQGYLWEWGWEWRHDGEVLNTSNCWPRLCTNWIVLSTGKTTIQLIRETNNCVIHWIGLSNLWSFEARYVNPGCLDKNFAPCVSLCAQGYMYTRRKKNLQYSSLPFRQAVLTFCMLVHIEQCLDKYDWVRNWLGRLVLAHWASLTDVLWGSSRVPNPLKSADLSGKKRRAITADFQIWQVHIGPC